MPGFWCQKVLPLVYDDSLSYYEVLCKMRDYINNLIDNDEKLADYTQELQNEINTINQWIANFDTTYIKQLVDSYVATMIFIEINDAGYIVYNMPSSWDDIDFNTTGQDIIIPNYEYGHLVLSY